MCAGSGGSGGSSISLKQALREPRRSQSCHLGLNNPRCHYLGHLSIILPALPLPPPPCATPSPHARTHVHFDQTIPMLVGADAAPYFVVCARLRPADCLFFHYRVGLTHSCTCLFNGFSLMENNGRCGEGGGKVGRVSAGRGVAETDRVFLAV